MSSIAWIIAGGLGMMAIALGGGLLLLLLRSDIERWVIPLVALAAGSLLGSALFYLLPRGVQRLGGLQPWVWCAAGFSFFFVLESVLRKRHGHVMRARPVNYLLLVGDGVHNLLGGLAVGGAFVHDIRLGLVTWFAAAAHEVPQELGDFGVLVNGGWTPRRALTWNLISASTFLLGGLLAYALSTWIEVSFLLPFAAGSFIYIAASDLVPEIWHEHTLSRSILNSGMFLSGLAVLLLAGVLVRGP